MQTRADCFAAADAAVKMKAANFRAAESERIEKLYEKYPRLGGIEKELRENIRDFSVFAFSGSKSEEAFNAYREKSLSLQAERREVLKENGLPENSCDVRFRCEKCQDNGYTDDGWCECFKRELSEQFMQISNISEAFRGMRLENFDLSYYSDASDNERMKLTLDYAKNYVKKFDKKKENLIFMGKSGSGKTFLSCAIASALIERGFFVYYTSAQDMVAALEAEKFGKDEKKDTKSLFESDLLVIDDLGSEYRVPFAETAIYNVVNSRMNAGKPMIISTNFRPEELDSEYHERIVSRLLNEFLTVVFADVDVRGLKKQRKR